MSVLCYTNEMQMSLYVHVPFCLRRCGYCDFCSLRLTSSNGSVLKRYDEIIIAELKLHLEQRPELEGAQISTVFFGGGTPTLLTPQQIGNIITTFRTHFVFDSAAEITTEANPDTLSASYIEQLAQNGITRLSIGVQSFDAAVLQILDRTHKPEQIAPALATAKNCGLQTSVDLIYGTPTETLDSWTKTVEQAISLNPDHISAYALSLEPSVPLARQITKGEVAEVDEDLQAQFYARADELLQQAGYEWYEISNWAKTESACKHNLHYWENHSWLGLGPSAHSHLYTSDGAEQRFWNGSDVNKYVADVDNCLTPVAECETIDNKTHEFEQTMLNVRLNKPVDALPRTLRHLQAQGLIDDNFIPTLKGRMLNDEIVRIIDAQTICPRLQTTRCMSCPQCIME
jgi:oxygen-independent coproporphyrinogen-3 oxidase